MYMYVYRCHKLFIINSILQHGVNECWVINVSFVVIRDIVYRGLVAPLTQHFQI